MTSVERSFRTDIESTVFGLRVLLFVAHLFDVGRAVEDAADDEVLARGEHSQIGEICQLLLSLGLHSLHIAGVDVAIERVHQVPLNKSRQNVQIVIYCEGVKLSGVELTADLQTFGQNDILGVILILELVQTSKGRPFATWVTGQIAQFLNEAQVEDHMVLWNLAAEDNILSEGCLKVTIDLVE